MDRVSRLTISVPTKLLEAADRRLLQEGEARDALICRLLEAALRKVEERADIERYVRGYLEQPQTEDELGWSDQAAVEHFAALPWKPEK